MNDITKARYYLKAKQSDLQHLTSFGMMLATAENRYKELKLKKQGNRESVGTYDKQEADAMLDLAVLKHLNKYNRLPKDLPLALQPNVTSEEKKDFAKMWSSA